MSEICAGDIAAQLSQRVTLLSPQKNPDGVGGYDIVWQDERTLWMSVDILPQPENALAGRTARALRLKLRCRSGIDISPEWRLRWQGSVFALISVTPDPENEALQLLLASKVQA